MQRIYLALLVHFLTLMNGVCSEEKTYQRSNTIINRFHYTKIESTQITIDDHLNRISQNNWAMVSADSQTGGKGMWNRSWVSLPGNVFVTYGIWLPKSFLPYLVRVPHIAGVALCDTLEHFGLSPKLRWINNALIEEKKIGGILCGLQLGSNIIAKIGIGINVSLTEETAQTIDQPVTSLLLELKNNVPSVENVLDILTTHIHRRFSCINELSSTFQLYDNLLAYKGKELKIYDGEQEYQGIFLRVNEHGYLQLQMVDEVKSFITGEIVPGSVAKSQ